MRLPEPTERLSFGVWSTEDEALARGLWGNPAVTALIAAQPLSADAVLSWLTREVEALEQHGFQYFPVFLRDGGAHVGCCGLRQFRPGQPELGVHMRPECWGKGLAAEACRSVIAFAFDVVGVASLFAGHHPDNRASGTLLQRLGFVSTGLVHYPPTGLMHPSYELTQI